MKAENWWLPDLNLPDGVPHKVTRVHDEYMIEPLSAEDQAAEQAAVEKALATDREAALRDVFATAALGALLSNPGQDHPANATTLAQRAYRYADAMLAERKATTK